MKGEERLLFKPKAQKTLLSSHIVNSMNSNHARTFNTCLCCSVVDIEAKTLASKDPVPRERKQRPQPCYLQPLVIDDFPLSFSQQINTLGSLSKDVFEQRTSTGSEDFSLVVCLDAM